MQAGKKSTYENTVGCNLNLIEGYVRDGYLDKDICAAIGISQSAFYKWKNEHKEFADILKRSKAVVDYEVENALLQNAKNGNVTAQIFWLKNRRPDKWREKVTELVAKEQGINLTIKLEDCSGRD